jgi:hypothetical protein
MAIGKWALLLCKVDTAFHPVRTSSKKPIKHYLKFQSIVPFFLMINEALCLETTLIYVPLINAFRCDQLNVTEPGVVSPPQANRRKRETERYGMADLPELGTRKASY